MTKSKAWTIFSKYIRLKNADWRGYVKCCTCGKTRQWNDRIDAGHFISRRHNATFFDERNVHPQCKGCNMGTGEPVKYYQFMEDTYGRETIDELYELSRTNKKFTKKELIELTDKWKNESRIK